MDTILQEEKGRGGAVIPLCSSRSLPQGPNLLPPDSTYQLLSMEPQAENQACGFAWEKLQVQIISLSKPVLKHVAILTFSHFSLCSHVPIELIIRKHAIFHFVSKLFHFFFLRQSLMYSRLTCNSLCIQAVKDNLRLLILLFLPPQF